MIVNLRYGKNSKAMTKSIKILGTGCARCQSLTGLVTDVVSKNHIDATIEKVEDIQEIMKYNVIATPALVVDDVIKTKGRIPSKEEILAILN